MNVPDHMDHPVTLWQGIAEHLAHGEGVALATVIGLNGPGPREMGASMAVTKGGRFLGTVGGGILEARVLELAGRVIGERLPVLENFSFAGRDATAGGMVCGGGMEVLVDFLDPADPICVRIFKPLMAGQQESCSRWLVRSIRVPPDGKNVKTGLGLMAGEAFDAGSLDGSRLDEGRLKRERRQGEAVLLDCGDIRYFIQPVGVPETVFIFGAGHIALALAPVCAIAGFRIVVIDDRPEFAAHGRFPAAAGIVAAESFPGCFDQLAIDASGYIVIVTHGHALDRDVLSRALRTRAGYIGMIASRRKKEIIFRSLAAEEGFTEEELARVHSPIGIEIGARTPGEIAVSIAAEMVAVRAGKLR